MIKTSTYFGVYVLVLTEEKVMGTWKKEPNSEKSQTLPADSHPSTEDSMFG